MKRFSLTSWLVVTLLLVAAAIRLINLSNLPPSPYWEEAALGYDAYSIFKTGKDHHGNQLPVVALESFGDWKPALYAYAIIPFIAVFDLSIVSVRLPSALAGVAIVGGVGALSWLWWQDKSQSLLAMLAAAIMPWAVFFSRAGWEVNLATAIFIWAIVCWEYGQQTLSKSIQTNRSIASAKLSLTFVLSILGFVLTLYTYHAYRILSPLIGVYLGCSLLLSLWSHRKKLEKSSSLLSQIKIVFLTTGVVGGMILISGMLPIITALQSPIISQRFAETSIFSNLQIIESSNYHQELVGRAWWSRIVYHRYFFFAREVLVNFFDHLTIKYWFVTGDPNPRHSSQYFGLLYPVDLLPLVIGIGVVASRLKQKRWFLAFWTVVSLVPASLTTATPHALRTLALMPVVSIVLGWGTLTIIEYLTTQLKTRLKLSTALARKTIMALILFGYSGLFIWFWRYYSTIYSIQYAQEWQFGYKEMVQTIATVSESKPSTRIFISREYGRPAMYYWFYAQTDPSIVQAQNQTSSKDQGEFLSFNNIAFVTLSTQVNLDEDGSIIVAGSPAWLAPLLPQMNNATLIEEITGSRNTVIWQVYEVQQQ